MSQVQTKEFTYKETSDIAIDLEETIINRLKENGVKVTGYKLLAITSAVQMLTREMTRKN